MQNTNTNTPNQTRPKAYLVSFVISSVLFMATSYLLSVIMAIHGAMWILPAGLGVGLLVILFSWLFFRQQKQKGYTRSVAWYIGLLALLWVGILGGILSANNGLIFLENQRVVSTSKTEMMDENISISYINKKRLYEKYFYENITISGFVVDKYDCLPCPKEGLCVPCVSGDYIILGEENPLANKKDDGNNYNSWLKVFVEDSGKFDLGKYYTLSLSSRQSTINPETREYMYLDK